MNVKKNISTIIMIVILMCGLGLLLYPTVSDYINQMHQSKAVATYVENVAKLDDGKYKKMLKEAKSFNEELFKSGRELGKLLPSMRAEYFRALSLGGSGVMGYIEIPKINCSLPIYHGTDDTILQIAVGHIEGSSLPVGGKNTHCVLSGHRGLPSAKLFTDLDKLTIGDTFVIRTLDEMLTYEVDQILIVLPEDVSELAIKDGKDLCTLVTCTPYGVNSHRILCRGHRVKNADKVKDIRVTSDAMQIEPMIVAPVVAAPILLILLISMIIYTGKEKRKNKVLKKRKKEK